MVAEAADVLVGSLFDEQSRLVIVGPMLLGTMIGSREYSGGGSLPSRTCSEKWTYRNEASGIDEHEHKPQVQLQPGRTTSCLGDAGTEW